MILTPWKEFQMPLTIRLLSTLLVAALSLATPLSSDAKCEAPGAIWASRFEFAGIPRPDVRLQELPKSEAREYQGRDVDEHDVTLTETMAATTLIGLPIAGLTLST